MPMFTEFKLVYFEYPPAVVYKATQILERLHKHFSDKKFQKIDRKIYENRIREEADTAFILLVIDKDYTDAWAISATYHLPLEIGAMGPEFFHRPLPEDEQSLHRMIDDLIAAFPRPLTHT